MGLLARLQPRDADLAARVLATLALVAGGVTVVFAAVQPGEQGATPVSLLLTVVSVAAVVAVALLLRRMRTNSSWVWAVFPFAAIGVIVFLDLFTSDATASAQVFFLFPALYGGFTLRRTGAILVGGGAIAGDLVDVLTLLPARIAVVQAGYVVAAVATTVALLVLSGERQDALVAELRTQAAVDSLTGLVTRRVLDEAASSALSGAASEKGTGLILLDIDNFKRVNDEHGHLAGDEVLVQVSQLLLQSSRDADTISRMGGDEIAVLLAGCSWTCCGSAPSRSCSPCGNARSRPRPARRCRSRSASASRTCPRTARTCAPSTARPTPRCTSPSDADATRSARCPTPSCPSVPPLLDPTGPDARGLYT